MLLAFIRGSQAMDAEKGTVQSSPVWLIHAGWRGTLMIKEKARRTSEGNIVLQGIFRVKQAGEGG